jgi:hypothetical protein
MLACKSRMLMAVATLSMAMAATSAHATFPGDNGVIVFTNPSTGMILRTGPNGGAVTSLAAGTSPSVSPSGKKIAYVSGSNVHVMNIDGTNDAQVTSTGNVVAVAWRRDGLLEEATQGLDAGGEYRNTLYRMNPDGTDVVATSQTLGWDDTTARIATLVASPQVSEGAFSIANPYLIEWHFDTTQNNFDFKNTEIRSSGFFPTFAPDGLMTYLAPNLVPHLRNFDGTTDSVLPVNGTTNGMNTVSPDGAQIAAPVGSSNFLQTRGSLSGTPLLTWGTPASYVEWSRVPKNCFETSTQGGQISPPGGSANGEFYATQCAIAYMRDGGSIGGFLMQAVAVGQDGRVYVSTLGTAAGAGWTAWYAVPGVNFYAGGVAAKKVALAGAKDGSLQIVIIGTDDIVYHTVRNPDGYWQGSGFQPVLHGSQYFKARDVSITINADSASSPGNAQIVANGLADGSLYHNVRMSSGLWNGWAMIPTSAGLNTTALAIAAAPDGNNTYVVVTAASSSYTNANVLRQIRHLDGSWDAFSTVYTPSSVVPGNSAIALTITPAGKAQFMYTDLNGAHFEEFANPSLPNAWAAAVTNILLDRSGKTVSISAPPSGTAASAVLTIRTSAQ